MFDSVNDLDAAGTVAGCEVTQRTVVVESCRTLVLAAHWADLYPAEGIPAQRVPGQETPRHPGGEGTPGIAGFAPAELGPVLGATAGAASRLIGDALDLRHRLPLSLAAGGEPGRCRGITPAGSRRPPGTCPEKPRPGSTARSPRS